MPTEKIPTKVECYERYNAGAFGNKPLTWDSPEEIRKSGWSGRVCIRSKIGTRRGNVRYNIPLSELDKEIASLMESDVKIKHMRFNQSMPDEHLTIQGELMRTERGLYLLYSTIQFPMNEALRREQKHVFGLQAHMLLRQNLYPSSLSDIEALLEIYQDSVIEFSSYKIPVGNIPGRNTIIWEVRNY